MRSIYFFVLAFGFSPGLSAETGPATASQMEAASEIAEVLVEGEYPGPGLWKVQRADDPSDHVLWIVAEPPPLPKKMKWKSAEIEGVVRGAQEILFPSALVVEPDGRIGFFKGMSLLPAALGARKNPDGTTLKGVLPPELYARWLALKKRYLPRSKSAERWRPIFAAEKLEEKAFSKSGFASADVVRAVVSELAQKHQIKLTTPSVRFTFPVDTIKPALEQFSREHLDDTECFETTLDLVEAIGDRDTMSARAHAWATADLATLSAIPLPDPSTACGVAFLKSTVAQDILPADIEAQMNALWMDQAEKSLAQNVATLAVLPLSQLTHADGYLAQLRARGYVVAEPGQHQMSE